MQGGGSPGRAEQRAGEAGGALRKGMLEGMGTGMGWESFRELQVVWRREHAVGGTAAGTCRRFAWESGWAPGIQTVSSGAAGSKNPEEELPSVPS